METGRIKKYLKIFAIGIAVLLLGFYILNTLFKQRIRELTKLSPAIQIKYSSLHANIFTASAFFDDPDIRFVPYPDLPEKKHVASFQKMSVKGIDIFSAIFSGKISIGLLSLEKGDIRADKFLIDKRDSLQSRIFENMQRRFKSIGVHRVVISGMKFAMQAEGSGLAATIKDFSIFDIRMGDATNAMPVTVREIDLSGLSASYHDKVNKIVFQARINIDSVKMNPFRDSVHFVSLKGNLSDVKFSNSTRHHNIHIRNVELNSIKEQIRLYKVQVIPQFGQYEFERKLGHQADVISASISQIDILQPDINGVFDKQFIAKKIRIGPANVHIFRDRRLPRPQKISPLPVTFLKTVPIDIRVKALELASSTVVYEEYPKEGFGKTGILRLEKVEVSVHSLINHPLRGDPDYINMRVHASLMGSGTADAHVRMPIRNRKPYLLTGKLEKVDLTKLNSSSENLGHIRIKSGFLDFLTFDFAMDEQRSTGKIIGAYHHLIIQQLKKHTSTKKVAGFPSFMLRRLIIPLNKDESISERRRTGKVDYKRDPTRFVSYYFLQSLLMGVKKSFTLGFLLPK